MTATDKSQEHEGSLPKRRAWGARLLLLLPWVALLALALLRGGALGDAARRNLANRPYLVTAMRPAGEAAPLPADRSPTNGFQARALAAVVRAEGRPAEALPWLTTVLAADPLDLTRFEACRLYVAQGQTAEAKGLCRNTPATASYWLAQGIAADESGRAADAIVYFDLARTADPNLLTAWERLGRVYLNAQRPADTVAVYEHLLKVQARPLADTYTQLGAAYTALGRPEDARLVLERGLERYPFQREMQLALADTARATGDLAAADAWYARLLAQQPEDAYAWARRGELALERSRAQDAIVYLDKATTIAPATVGYWLSLATAAADAGDVARATAAYEQALALAPQQIDFHLAAARFFTQSGQPARARAIYERVLSIEPDNRAASEALAGLATDSAAP
ncbi:MAG: tetratricopeptide repeat protein [Candidatus Promineofilum sp.]|nr:tetratricopeptide repeat protein [Promineifilum sp.]